LVPRYPKKHCGIFQTLPFSPLGLAMRDLDRWGVSLEGVTSVPHGFEEFPITLAVDSD